MVGIKAAALALFTLLGLAEKNSNDKSGDKVGLECLKYDDKEQTKCRTWRFSKHAEAMDLEREKADCASQCRSLGEECRLRARYELIEGVLELVGMYCRPVAPEEDVKMPVGAPILPIYHGEL
ncbi:hypothetical protein CB0940_06923 [Cercospora beticola]|uniref:Apple domain-containing protein n=1 Tax=Cercospora beticola TaxID=122368 RepID=A0A2G5HA26_CERBT|nr:hypothetical protein CB0940_06923 [Cercospora beticola]PIA89082.1 hypothetical protein CB0940_06923 [Cercospora beticola]WPB02841.1 hypothetical protein RHO25_007477 [Cercospora beticola]